MGDFNKWTRGEEDLEKLIYVVLFTSRNKDNKHIDNFTERRNAFVTTKTADELRPDFEAFVSKGINGEMSRMYYSVNARSNSNTQKALLHQLIDNQYNMASIPQRIAALAAQKENAIESKWLFDFDFVDGESIEALLEEFVKDIRYYHERTETKKGATRPKITVDSYKTPNGYATIVDQRFDTRELLAKWSNVELKRDDLRCVMWDTK